MASGKVQVGDDVTALPSGKTSKVKSIFTYEGELQTAQPGQAITITLEDEIDVSRGDMIVHTGHEPKVTNQFEAHLVWMDEQPMLTYKEYLFKFATKGCTGKAASIVHKVDVNTLEKHAEDAESLELNEIALTNIELTDNVALDEYQALPQTGAFIVIDRISNVTVGAGMVSKVSNQGGNFEGRVYTNSEKALNAFIRQQFPEWECKAI